MSLGMYPQTVGRHELTFSAIYSLLASIYDDRLYQNIPNTDAAKLLYISYVINVKDNIFTTVRLGDIDILITDGYYGKKFRDMSYEVATINNRLTIFIFKDTLTNPKIPAKIKVARIFEIYNMLVGLYADPELKNLSYTIYGTIIFYAPVVMTIRLAESVFNKEFSTIDGCYDNIEYIFGNCYYWLNDEALKIIHNCTDSALLEYGALVEHIANYENRLSEN